MKSIFFAFIFVLTTFTAHAEIYNVEPMVCKGKWNKNPGGWHPENENVKIVMVSARSVRASDCSLAPTGTAESGPGSSLDETVEARSWVGAPLRIVGTAVTAPFDYRANPFELTVVESVIERGIRTDFLKGRSYLTEAKKGKKAAWYDYECTATVVEVPKTIINQTKRCP